MDQLGKIVNVLGTSDLHAYISKTKIEMTKDIRKVIAKCTLRGAGRTKPDWLSLVTTNDNDNDDSSYIPNIDGIDLLSRLLVYDHEVRLTAKQAMQHTFFDSVRDKIERQMNIQQEVV